MEIHGIMRSVIAACIIAANLIPMMVSLLILWPARPSSIKERPASTPASETHCSFRQFCARSKKRRAVSHTIKKRNCAAAAALCLCIYACSYIMVQHLAIRYWDLFPFLRRAVSLDFTDLDLSYFALFISLETIAAGIASYFFFFLFSLYSRKNVRTHGILRHSRKRTAMLYLFLSVVGLSVSGTLYYSFSAARKSLVINEIGSNNISIPLDQSGTVCDYIELYNKGNLPCAINELYLSDDESDLKKKELSKMVIPAHGHLMIKLDDHRLTISKDREETVFLSDHLGYIIDQISTVAVEANFSYSRADDAAENWLIYRATPGETNKKGTRKLDTVLRLSHDSGFYEDAFDLQITAEDGLTIHYTLDGSIPTKESEIYTQPIRVYNRSGEPNVWASQQRIKENWADYTPNTTPVDKAFIIRAVAIDAEGAVSAPISASYFIGLEEYKHCNVISLIVDPEDFWGKHGIYVTGNEYDLWYSGEETDGYPAANFRKRGRAWEKPAHLIYLSGDDVSEQRVGVRISGASTRAFPIKYFSLYARDVYSGSDTFTLDIFKDIQSKSLSLRTDLASAFCQSLAPDRSFGIQRSKRACVFINGEFWHDYNILEKYDEQYFYEHYGVHPNNLVIMKHGALDEGMPGDESLLNDLYDYLAANDLSDSERYEAFAEIVDIQSYIDYMCFNIYIDNMDFSEEKNTVWWRSRRKTSNPYEDGRWRFLLYDLDAIAWNDSQLWGVGSQAEKNTFALIPRFAGNQAIAQQPIMAALRKNPEFVKRFVLTFMDMANTNFRYDRVQLALEKYIQSGKSTDVSYYDDFFTNRASYIVPYMAEEFSLTGTLESLHLGTNDHLAGYIQLNTITPDLSQGDWCGQYYTDYPVTVTAVAREGYRFKGWSGSVHSQEESIELNLSTGGMSLYAIFEKEAS